MAIKIIKTGKVFQTKQCSCRYCDSILEYSVQDIIKFNYQDSVVMRGNPPKKSYKTDKVANFICPNCKEETIDVYEEDLGVPQEEKIIEYKK